MKLKNEIIIILCIILLALFFRFGLWEENKFSADFFHHYTIVAQAIEKGELDNKNSLSVCYEGAGEGHPKGFYLLPYSIGKSIGPKWAFMFVILGLGIVTLVFGYYLIRMVFGYKVALLTIFLTAISAANVSKSYPGAYRGELLIYPFLLLSLILLYKGFQQKKLKKGSMLTAGGGIASGLTIAIWNGFPLIYIIPLAAAICYATFHFWKGNKVKNALLYASIFIGAQAITGYALAGLNNSLRRIDFMGSFYPLIIAFCLSLFAVLYLSQRYKVRYTFLGIYAAALITLVLVNFERFKVLLFGYGSVNKLPQIGMATEIMSPNFYQVYLFFSILPIIFVIGLFYFIKEFDEKKAFYLGLVIPALYLIASAARFFFFASLPLIAIASIIADKKLLLFKKKKFNLFLFLTILVCIVMFFFALYNVPSFFSHEYPEKRIKALEFIKENTPKKSCVISNYNLGADVEFYAKRYNYFHSLGIHRERLKKVFRFLLENEEIKFEEENLYFLFTEEDLLSIYDFAVYTGTNDMEQALLFKPFEQETYLDPGSNTTYHFIDEGKEEKVIKVRNRTISYVKSYYNEKFIFKADEGDGCLYRLGGLMHFNNKICNSNLYKMITQQRIQGLEKIYAKDGVVIYHVVAS